MDLNKLTQTNFHKDSSNPTTDTTTFSDKEIPHLNLKV